MKRHTLAGLGLALAVHGAAALAQDAPAPEGLDTTGRTEGEHPNTPPVAGWEQDQVAHARIKKLTDACFSACHGYEKRTANPAVPRIAGQKFYYVRKQLETFNENNPDGAAGNAHHWSVWARSNAYMNQITTKVRAQYYAYIADMISKMPCDEGRAAVPPATALPSPKTLRLCVSCHGADGLGTAYDVPNIAGLSYTYLRGQLTLFRKFEKTPRKAGGAWRGHPGMELSLDALSEFDTLDLAKYYADRDCRGAAKPEP